MAKTNITEFSNVASNNTDINNVNIDENCPASNLNNALRELMKALKDVDTGSQALTALSVTGETTLASHLNMGDNDKIKLGASGDLEIYHDGSHSYVDDTGTGDLRLRGNDQVRLQKYTGENMITCNVDDGVQLYHDNVEKFVTSSSGIVVNNKVQGASGESLTIEAQSGGAVIINTNGASEKARLTSGGAFLVGVTDASPFVATEGHVVALNDGTRYGILTGCDHTGNREAVAFVNPNGQVGSIRTNGTATSFNTSSDHRIKENVEDMTGAIDRVKQLLPKRFNFIADETDTLVDGFLAHEAQSVVAEAVHGTHNEVDDDGNPVMQGIDQSKIVPLLTGALKEAIAKIETLETANTALEARITALENA